MQRFIRMPEVERRVGAKKTFVYKRIAAGDFPPPVRLSPTMSAWVESEVDAWIAARIAAARSQEAA